MRAYTIDVEGTQVSVVLGGEIELYHPLSSPSATGCNIQASPSSAPSDLPPTELQSYDSSVKPYHTFLPTFDYDDLLEHLVKCIYPTIDHSASCDDQSPIEGDLDLTSHDSSTSSSKSQVASYTAYLEGLLSTPMLMFIQKTSAANAL